MYERDQKRHVVQGELHQTGVETVFPHSRAPSVFTDIGMHLPMFTFAMPLDGSGGTLIKRRQGAGPVLGGRAESDSICFEIFLYNPHKNVLIIYIAIGSM